MTVAGVLLKQRKEVVGAIGRRGILLAAAAALLLILAFFASLAAVVSLHHQRKVDGGLAGELAELIDETERVSMALLAALGTVDGRSGMGNVRDQWATASERIAEICAGPAGRDWTAPQSLCERLMGWRRLLDRDLSPGLPLSASDLHQATTNVLDLVGYLAKYKHEFRDHAIEVRSLVGEQRSLLILLVAGTGGAMASSSVLFYLVVGAAASNQRRRLAAEMSEDAAIETRQQLMEAIEAIPVGFGLYDRDGRMVMFNSRLAEVNPDVYKPEILGLHYEEIIERLVAWRPVELDDREKVREVLLARFRDARPGHVQLTPDGRYFNSYEVHAPSGYIASCRVDITALKRREAELEASQARHRHVVDSMLDAVFTTDASGVTYVSPAAERVLGLAPEKIAGISPTQLFHPDDVSTMIEGLRAAQRAPGTIQTLRIRAGGLLPTQHWLDLRFKATGAPDANGRYSLIGVVRDIDAQVQLEQAQLDDMLKLRSIVESSGALIALVNSHQRIVLANRTFLEAVGKPLEGVISQRYGDVIDCGEDGGALESWFAGERREALAFDQVMTSGGARRVVRVTASHVHDDDRDLNYSLFLGVDETERRSAEVRAIDASRLATLGEMATGIAHEINQPLTVVQFAADAIAADLEEGLHRDDPEGYAEDALRHLGRVRNQAQRAAAIVRRLQGFARKGDDIAQPFDIAEAIAGATDLVAEQMRLARINVELDLPDGLPSVHGHANRLQQVVINLMINARDAIQEDRARRGGPAGQDRIDIRAAHDRAAGRLVLEIGDSGPGIPEHVLPRLFESFFTTKPKGKGTGLGLSISTEIMSEMQGTIAVENRPQGGALFRLSFPIVNTGLQAAA